MNTANLRHAILYGGTGQSKVVRPILEAAGVTVVAVVDDTPGLTSPFVGVPILQGIRDLGAWLSCWDGRPLGFAITIGNPHGRVRLKLHDELEGLGLNPLSVIHPKSIVAPSVILGAGVQIMAGAVVQDEVVLGKQVIVNTNASVDHETVLEDGVEIAPGATLCGCIRVRKGAWVCAGATVLPRLEIGEDAIVGAGALVRRNVRDGSTVVGVPARDMNARLSREDNP